MDLLNPPLPKEGREIVKAKYPEGIQELIVPSREPKEIPKLFTKNEFDRLKRQAKV